MFDTGLSVTPLMGHLGCLASHWSVPVQHNRLAASLLQLVTYIKVFFFTLGEKTPCIQDM